VNPFITYREKDDKGVLQYYILQRDFPHLVGVILPNFTIGNWYAPISGYMLWVNFTGTLRGNQIPSYQDVGKEIQSILDNMSCWFGEQRIAMDEKRFKKFKINAATAI